jgi:hypothetical protein
VMARRDVLRLAFAMRPRRMQPDEGPADFLRRMTAFLDEHGHGQLRCGSDDCARILFGLFQATLIPFVFADAKVDLSHEAARITDYFLHGVEKRPPPQRT